jgi:hypothetical protein
MMFTKRLREGVRCGEITCSVRFWMYPRVRAGGRYPMEEGWIKIDSVETIGFPDITPELARESGFLGVLDLLKVAKHGRSEKIYLVRFHYLRGRAKKAGSRVRRTPRTGLKQACVERRRQQAAALQRGQPEGRPYKR